MKHAQEPDTITEVLNKVQQIVLQDKEDKREKGEDFNVFSVMQMESNETKTHSNMLAALLNPKQDHYYGAQFLKLFLEQIGYDYEGENLNQTRIQTEYHLGKINKEYTEGGFIDILITFSSGKTIAIENKIYAGDQKFQIYRYSLYNQGNSSLYYLNLFGDNPSKESLNGLKEEAYSKINYAEDIVNWLNTCIQIVKAGSIVEATLKQYLYLIRKLTFTMDNKLEDQLSEVILNNLEAAKYIQTHYQRAVLKVREKFRAAIAEALKKHPQLQDGKVFLGNACSHRFSQIWIDLYRENRQFKRFGIESFSGKGVNNNQIFVGILDKGGKYDFKIEGCKRHNAFWPVIKDIKTPEDNFLNISSTGILEQLAQDSTYFENMVEATVKQAVAFIAAYSEA